MYLIRLLLIIFSSTTAFVPTVNYKIYNNNINMQAEQPNTISKGDTYADYMARRTGDIIVEKPKNDRLQEKGELYIDYMARRRKEYMDKILRSHNNYYNRGEENDN
mgnify:CR=1 FL=1